MKNPPLSPPRRGTEYWKQTKIPSKEGNRILETNENPLRGRGKGWVVRN